MIDETVTLEDEVKNLSKRYPNANKEPPKTALNSADVSGLLMVKGNIVKDKSALNITQQPINIKKQVNKAKRILTIFSIRMLQAFLRQEEMKQILMLSKNTSLWDY